LSDVRKSGAFLNPPDSKAIENIRKYFGMEFAYILKMEKGLDYQTKLGIFTVFLK